MQLQCYGCVRITLPTQIPISLFNSGACHVGIGFFPPIFSSNIAILQSKRKSRKLLTEQGVVVGHLTQHKKHTSVWNVVPAFKGDPMCRTNVTRVTHFAYCGALLCGVHSFSPSCMWWCSEHHHHHTTTYEHRVCRIYRQSLLLHPDPDRKMLSAISMAVNHTARLIFIIHHAISIPFKQLFAFLIVGIIM